jgi:hypothetical protein
MSTDDHVMGLLIGLGRIQQMAERLDRGSEILTRVKTLLGHMEEELIKFYGSKEMLEHVLKLNRVMYRLKQ